MSSEALFITQILTNTFLELTVRELFDILIKQNNICGNAEFETFFQHGGLMER